jgi:hypothetical protein
MLYNRVVRAGDGKGLRAVKLSWLPYFVNTGGDEDISHVSKYAFYLVQDHINFERASSRLKYRLDRHATVNTSGCSGHNIEHDLSNEHYNKCSRRIWKSANGVMTKLKKERATLGHNTTERITEQLETSVGWAEGKGGDTANMLFSEADKEEIHFQFVSKKPYDKDLSKGSFNQEMMSVYSGDAIKDMDNLENYFDMQKYHYKLDHQFTMF